MRHVAGFVLGAVVALAVTVPFASAAASTGSPQPGATSAVGVSVTIPTTPGRPRPRRPHRAAVGAEAEAVAGHSSTPDPGEHAADLREHRRRGQARSRRTFRLGPSSRRGRGHDHPGPGVARRPRHRLGRGLPPDEKVEAVIYSQATARSGASTPTADGTIEARVSSSRRTPRSAVHTLQLVGWTSCVVAGGDDLHGLASPGSGESIFPWIVWVVVGVDPRADRDPVCSSRVGWDGYPFGRRPVPGTGL